MGDKYVKYRPDCDLYHSPHSCLLTIGKPFVCIVPLRETPVSHALFYRIEREMRGSWLWALSKGCLDHLGELAAGECSRRESSLLLVRTAIDLFTALALSMTAQARESEHSNRTRAHDSKMRLVSIPTN